VRVRLTLLLLATGLGANCATLTPLPQARGPVPPFDAKNVRRVVLIILENGNPAKAAQQSFMKDRAAEGMLLTRYFAVAHPSQPNYVALISGSTAGALTDSPITLDRPHLGRILGDRWRVYADDYPALPGKCNLIKQQDLYVRRHVPFLSFKDVQTGTCSQIEPFPAIKTDPLPDFALIVPNLQHDGHRPFTLNDANAWLNANIAPLLADPKFAKDTVFILTFDEDDTFSAQSNRVFAVLWGDHVQHGARDDVYDHEDLLATIAALLGVKPPPFDEMGVRPIGGIWK
jgi:acid phosphatase